MSSNMFGRNNVSRQNQTPRIFNNSSSNGRSSQQLNPFGGQRSNNQIFGGSNSMQSSNQYQSSNTGNMWNTSNRTNMGSNQPLKGSYRVDNYLASSLPLAMERFNSKWKPGQHLPISFVARGETMHLSVTQLRIEDYYQIKKNLLRDEERQIVKNCVQNKNLNPQIFQDSNTAKQPLTFETEKFSQQALRKWGINRLNSSLFDKNNRNGDIWNKNGNSNNNNNGNSNIGSSWLNKNTNNSTNPYERNIMNTSGNNSSSNVFNRNTLNNNSSGNIFGQNANQNNTGNNLWGNASRNQTGDILKNSNSGGNNIWNNNSGGNSNNNGGNSNNNGGNNLWNNNNSNSNNYMNTSKNNSSTGVFNRNSGNIFNNNSGNNNSANNNTSGNIWSNNNSSNNNPWSNNNNNGNNNPWSNNNNSSNNNPWNNNNNNNNNNNSNNLFNNGNGNSGNMWNRGNNNTGGNMFNKNSNNTGNSGGYNYGNNNNMNNNNMNNNNMNNNMNQFQIMQYMQYQNQILQTAVQIIAKRQLKDNSISNDPNQEKLNTGIHYKSINNNYKSFDNRNIYGQKNQGVKKVLPFDRIDFDHLQSVFKSNRDYKLYEDDDLHVGVTPVVINIIKNEQNQSLRRQSNNSIHLGRNILQYSSMNKNQMINEQIYQNEQQQFAQIKSSNQISSIPSVSQVESKQFGTIKAGSNQLESFLYKVRITYEQSPQQTQLKQYYGQCKHVYDYVEQRVIIKNLYEQTIDDFPQEHRFSVNHIKDIIILTIKDRIKFENQFTRQTKKIAGIVEAQMIIRKINLPGGYTFTPKFFKGTQVNNLEIMNQYGSVLWENTTNIARIDFGKKISIREDTVNCFIPQLNKQCWARMKKIPQVLYTLTSDEAFTHLKKYFIQQFGDQYEVMSFSFSPAGYVMKIKYFPQEVLLNADNPFVTY